MNQREEIIERLRALELSGGSHEMLSAICRAVAPGAQYGWTQGACDGLRLRLISFLSETDEEAMREAYTKGCNDGFDRGFASADDWCAQHEDAMAEHGWVHLPVDADGEYIHVGDELHDEWHEQKQGEVERLMLDRYGWWLMFKSSCERFYVHEFHEWRHHHKQPTVEDVLRELADVVRKERVELATISDETIAEYATKLRLAGDAE